MCVCACVCVYTRYGHKIFKNVNHVTFSGVASHLLNEIFLFSFWFTIVFTWLFINIL